MHSALSLALVLLGGLAIVWALRDVFYMVFHPDGQSGLNSTIPRLIWRAAKATGSEKALVLAGPCSLVFVVVTWVVLLAIGGGLIFWALMPDGFLYSGSLIGADNQGFGSAMYVSTVTLATLGYGDIVPVSGVLRVFAPIQAAIGFGLMTATLSWVISLHQVVQRQRSLAQRITLLEEDHVVRLIGEDPHALACTLRELIAQLTVARQDVLQFSISYYFHTRHSADALANALVHLRRLTALIPQQAGGGLAIARDELEHALCDYADALRERIFRDGSPSADDVLELYYQDHHLERSS